MESLSVTELFPAAAGVAMNPPAVMAVILMLSSAESRKSAFGFAFGWLIGLLVVGAAVLLVGDTGGLVSGSSKIGYIVKLLLGLLLLALVFRLWRRRAASAEAAEMPGWMRSIVGFSATKAFATGTLYSALNPKTLALNVAGAVVIAEAELSVSSQALLLLLFVLLASLTVIAPIIYYSLAPTRSQEVLAAAQRWLVAHNKAITATVLLLLGIMLVASGAQGFVAS